MASAAEIERELQRKVSAEVRLHPQGVDRYLISSPFTFDDGDGYVIILRREEGRWILTDEAHTFMHLSYKLDERAWQEGTRRQIIDDLTDRYDVTKTEGELVLAIQDDQFGNALFQYLQFLTRLTDIQYLSRESVRSTFTEDFKDLIENAVPTSRCEFEWNDSSRDPDRYYVADVRINHRHRPLFIFAVPSDDKAKDATITLLKYREWYARFDSLTIFENLESIGKKNIARLTDVADKQFSNLFTNREQIRTYLQDILDAESQDHPT